MSCIPLPDQFIPTLPSGVSITPPALPPFPPGVGEFCCKVTPFIPPIPLPPFPPLIVNSGAASAINAFIAGITAYLDQLPLLCPKE